MGRLTDITIKNAQSAPRDLQLSDGGGLVLRVGRGSGEKSFWYRYKRDNSSKWLRLGSYPLLSLKEARILAAQIDLRRKQGVDPIEEREIEEQRKLDNKNEQLRLETAQATRLTVNNLFERWASIELARRKDGGKEVRRMFEKDVLPQIGSMPVEDVRKGHISEVVDSLLSRKVTRMAKLIFALMRQMFRFAVDRDIIEFDPSAAIRKSKIGGKDTERERVLTEDEILALIKQIPAAGLLMSTEAAVWIALSTCCRIGELLGTRWEHIDFQKRTWWIRKDLSKNKKAHTIHLSDFALHYFQKLNLEATVDLLDRRKADPNAKFAPWIYPNRHFSGPVCSKTVTKQLGDRQRPGLRPMKGRAMIDKVEALVLIGGKWGPQDLRRTGATMMVRLGVLPDVAERCLNHTEQDRVKRTYQRYNYEDEMREAWEILGKRLSKIKPLLPDKISLTE